jgi:hypothetical protein
MKTFTLQILRINQYYTHHHIRSMLIQILNHYREVFSIVTIQKLGFGPQLEHSNKSRHKDFSNKIYKPHLII